MLGLEVFLGIIGGLTLLIGGIGVANIMYAVVKEKTREIGVQMALGAHRGWITGPSCCRAWPIPCSAAWSGWSSRP